MPDNDLRSALLALRRKLVKEQEAIRQQTQACDTMLAALSAEPARAGNVPDCHGRCEARPGGDRAGDVSMALESLRDAIACAPSGSTIVFAPASFGATLTITGDRLTRTKTWPLMPRRCPALLLAARRVPPLSVARLGNKLRCAH